MKKPNYQKPDYYARKAKESGFPARSVFKLAELDQRFKILTTGMRVLDLGAAPGSWMKYSAERVGEQGLVVGIDRHKLNRQLNPNEDFIQADVFAFGTEELKDKFGSFDLVLSDLAPDTMGQKATDALRSMALAKQALKIAEKVLKPGGNFLVKVFEGPGFEDFLRLLRSQFQSVKSFKPKSSRASSKEIYIFCKNYRD